MKKGEKSGNELVMEGEITPLGNVLGFDDWPLLAAAAARRVALVLSAR